MPPALPRGFTRVTSGSFPAATLGVVVCARTCERLRCQRRWFLLATPHGLRLEARRPMGRLAASSSLTSQSSVRLRGAGLTGAETQLPPLKEPPLLLLVLLLVFVLLVLVLVLR